MTGRTIGSITALQRGNSYKSTLLGDEGPKLLGLGSIQKDGGFKDSALKSYSGPTDPRHLLRPGDIYVSLKDVTQSGDLLGSIARVPAHIELGRLTQDTVKLEFVDAEFSRSYVYWALRTPQYRSYCRARALGTTNLSLSRDDFLSFELPPLTSFRSTIVEVLENIEEKIELNRRMAATLEEMARALYRSWFVDFDPVNAKAEGLAPAFMDEATAALFPDRFGDDGLPEGWSQVGLPEIATFLNGAALQKFPPGEGEESLPVIKIAELRNGVTPKSNRASVHLPSKYLIDDGDVLFSWSGSLLQKVWTEGPGALNQHLFKVSSDQVPKWFHYFAVDEHMEEFRLIAQSKATTMGHIQRHHLDAALVNLPDDSVMAAADSLIGNFFDRMVALNIENRTLIALRDTLLPKLMSGELRVGEARDQIEEIA